jgi:hypothetical protein
MLVYHFQHGAFMQILEERHLQFEAFWGDLDRGDFASPEECEVALRQFSEAEVIKQSQGGSIVKTKVLRDDMEQKVSLVSTFYVTTHVGQAVSHQR